MILSIPESISSFTCLFLLWEASIPSVSSRHLTTGSATGIFCNSFPSLPGPSVGTRVPADTASAFEYFLNKASAIWLRPTLPRQIKSIFIVFTKFRIHPDTNLVFHTSDRPIIPEHSGYPILSSLGGGYEFDDERYSFNIDRTVVFPLAVLKYFSLRSASYLLTYASKKIRSNGRRGFVDCTLPSLCCCSRLNTSSVKPIYKRLSNLLRSM